MLVQVLFYACPVWKLGEKMSEAFLRRSMKGDLPASERWGRDFTGRISSVRKTTDKSPDLRKMSDGMRPVIELDVSDEELDGIRYGTLKISAGTLVPVTLEDRWGSIALVLRANLTDPEAVENGDPDQDIEARRFAEIVALAAASLPATEAKTGTGLYCVKSSPTQLDRTQSGAPAGQVITLSSGGMGGADAFAGGYITNVTQAETRAIVSHTDTTATLEGSLTNWVDTDDLDIFDAWSTFQGVHDQLWVDQGSAAFTAPQIIRIFAGTYAENVTINESLNPALKNYLLIEANGADSVTIDGTAGKCISGIPSGGARFEGLILESTGDYGIAASGAYYKGEQLAVRNCIFNSNKGVSGGWGMRGSTLVEDCVFTGSSWGVVSTKRSPTVRRCRFHGQPRAVWVYQSSAVIEACIFDGCTQAIYGQDQEDSGVILRVANCTFYDCTDDIYMPWAGAHTVALVDLVAVNNIHVNSGRCYYVPAETALSHVDYNCIYNATKVATVDTTDKTTLADWQAYSDEWGNSPDADSLDSDPKLTNPGSDDFTLQSDSCCIHAGIGAGVPKGEGGDVLDLYHPDIGAKATGAGPNVVYSG